MEKISQIIFYRHHYFKKLISYFLLNFIDNLDINDVYYERINNIKNFDNNKKLYKILKRNIFDFKIGNKSHLNKILSKLNDNIKDQLLREELEKYFINKNIYKSFTRIELIDLYNLFVRFGKINTGVFFRELAIGKYLKEKNINFSKIKNKELDIYKKIFLDDRDNDPNFYKFIYNKDILIEAPSNVKQNIDNNIYKNKIIVKFNVRNENSSDYFRNCNVSYYNHQVTSYMHDNDKDFPVNISFYKLDTSLKKLNKKFLLSSKFSFFNSNKYNHYLINGKFNMVQTAIIDLLKYKPKSIYVLNANLMTTKARLGGYRVIKESEVNQLRGFVAHDPITQFRFMEILKDNNLIEFDDLLKNIVKKGEKSYIAKISELYGY